MAPQPSVPNVVLIVVDALRQDHLHLYGYPRRTSDTIDQLGKEGWTFENHIASASQTVPSTLSLLLSQYPAEHGFFHTGPGHFTNHPPDYPDSFNFLAEVFQEAGFATGGFTGNPFLDEDNGFSQGFEHFLNSRQDSVLTRSATRWLEAEAEAPTRRPLFLYMHYMGVHWPYKPPRRFRKWVPEEGGQLVYRSGLAPDVGPRDLEYTRAMYDGGIASVDEQVSSLLRALESLDLRENTIVVLTSDHGDEFLEHGGLGHGTHVFGELVRVPLILSYPKRLEAGRRIRHLSRHVDLAPTLLELTGVARPASFRGQSLGQPALSAITENGPWSAVYSADQKLVHDRRSGALTTYQRSDLHDQNPQAAGVESPLWLQLMTYEAQAARRETPTDAQLSWSPEELEQLKALGYVGN